MKYAVIYEKTPTGYSAYVPDLPGCVAAAGTFTETAELIRCDRTARGNYA